MYLWIVVLGLNLFAGRTKSYDLCGDHSLCSRHGTWNSLIGSSGICVCYYGYNGYCCQSDINECASNPCLNSGICHDGANRFSCSCPSGYAGDRCEIDINECASNPCMSYEVCMDHVNKYSCSCRPGFTGPKCEINIDDCGHDPCLNNATCIDGINNFTCACLPGFTGSNCQTDIDECSSLPCKNGGLCHDVIDGFECQCITGYIGKHCETVVDVDECTSNPCIYGYCLDGINSYTCFCRAGFTGTNCEREIDECFSQPCRNNGTCIDKHNNYTCICNGGDTGRNCEVGPFITEAPHVTSMTGVSVHAGSTVKIPCYAEGIPLPDIIWERIIGSMSPNTKQIAHFLVIENIQMTDSGYYSCTATNRIGSDVKVVHIIVKEHPSHPLVAPVITVPSIVNRPYFTSATINCSATGYPEPDITWEFNNVKVKSSPVISISTKYLTIKNITQDTTGVYTCVASNDAGSARANVVVESHFERPKITKPPHSFTGLSGTKHNFTCGFSGSPIPVVSWTYKSFTSMDTESQINTTFTENAKSTIELVLKEPGNIQCTVTNQYGSESASTFVIVKGEPPVVG